MRALVVVEAESGEVVEVTVVRRKVERTERGPGLSKLEPAVVETDGCEVVDLGTERARRAR